MAHLSFVRRPWPLFVAAHCDPFPRITGDGVCTTTLGFCNGREHVDLACLTYASSEKVSAVSLGMMCDDSSGNQCSGRGKAYTASPSSTSAFCSSSGSPVLSAMRACGLAFAALLAENRILPFSGRLSCHFYGTASVVSGRATALSSETAYVVSSGRWCASFRQVSVSRLGGEVSCSAMFVAVFHGPGVAFFLPEVRPWPLDPSLG